MHLRHPWISCLFLKTLCFASGHSQVVEIDGHLKVSGLDTIGYGDTLDNRLAKNHHSERSVWLILYNKRSDKFSYTHNDAVEEALCFGWIDSKANKRDDESRYQLFSKRKPKSNWSKLNKERVAKMTRAGQMTPAGQGMIDLAKKTGAWIALHKVQKNIIPDDLKAVLIKTRKPKFTSKSFLLHPNALSWSGSRPQNVTETRAKRMSRTVRMAKQNIWRTAAIT